MPTPSTRRRFLRSVGAAATAGTAALAGCSYAPPQSDDALDPLAETALDEQPYTQFQHGLRNRGTIERSVPDSVELDWRLAVNRGEHTAAKSTPVQTPEGDIVVAGDTGIVRRVTPAGEEVWRNAVEQTRRGVHGTPAVANGSVYVGAYDGALYAFDLASGEREWRTDLGDAIGSSPKYFNGNVYIAVEYSPPSGSVAAVAADSGVVRWMDYWPANHPHSTLAIDRASGTLTVGANDGRLYAWSFPDLDRLWRFETGGPVKGPVAVHDGVAVFGSWDQSVYGVDLADGTEVWSFETDQDVMSGPAVDADGTVYVGSHDSRLYALDAADGTERWRYDTGGWLIGAVVATPEHALVGSYDEHFHAVGEGGEATWLAEGNGQVTSAALVTEEAVYFAARATDEQPGYLYRYASG
jgi:outer membrane protein assembly factor BamB